MSSIDSQPDDDVAWAAVLRRDRAFDGRFVTGVLTTGIYCRASCPARHPARHNVRFFPDGASAGAAGLRACLRCRPDDRARDEAAVASAIDFIDRCAAPPSLTEVAQVAGYAPHHFQRIFKRMIGISPTSYARALRLRRAAEALNGGSTVTEAIYDAGYAAPSRFYAEAGSRLGMTPSVWKDGGRGVRIGWATAVTSLGPMLLAATERGVCRLSFGESEAALSDRFPNATISKGGPGLEALLAQAVAAVDDPSNIPRLPLDVRGTAFQEAVWRELMRIPPGETLSYAMLAARAGNPAAVRATGSACGANPVAVLIPCHRARRTDGSLGGYAYGLDRKKALLERESGADRAAENQRKL